MVLSKTILHFGSFPCVITIHIGIGQKNFSGYSVVIVIEHKGPLLPKDKGFSPEEEHCYLKTGHFYFSLTPEKQKVDIDFHFQYANKIKHSEDDCMSRHMMEIFRDYLLQHGLRLTRQRELIAETFFRHKGHISTEELHHQTQKVDSGIGYATVYRTIKLLSGAGLAAQRSFGECFARYEPATQSGHHDHLICTGCGKIIEFENDRIESLQQAVAIEHGFLVTDHKLELYGTCEDCDRLSG